MDIVGATLGWGLAVAASLILGAALAALLRLPDCVAATLSAFGGGVLSRRSRSSSCRRPTARRDLR